MPGSNEDNEDNERARNEQIEDVRERVKGLLSKRRANKKGQLTKFQNYITSLPDTDLRPNILYDLEARISKMDMYYGEFLQSELDSLEHLVADQDQIAERDIFDTAFFKAYGEARGKLEANYANRNMSRNSPNNGSGNINMNAPTDSHIRLPKIELPKFRGDSNDWIEFRDTYQSLIHENVALSSIQKYHYLRATLEGDAAQVIKSLGIGADTYDQAWRLLCQRYNNTRVLVYNHLKSLFDMPNIVKESSSKLRGLVDTISKHVGTLKSLGQQTDGWDSILLYLFVSKLDVTTTREWEIKVQSESDPKLHLFLQFLRNRATIIESVERKRDYDRGPTVDSRRTYTHDYKNAYHQQQQQQYRARSFAIVNREMREIKCAVCNEPHYTSYCDQLKRLSLEQRVDKVRSLKLCINCLRIGHFVQNCKSSNCKQCGLKHNTLLHRYNNNIRSAETHGQSIDSEPRRQENTQAQIENNSLAAVATSFTSNTHTATSNASNALLPTALVCIAGSDGKFHVVRALLDSCSQANFITARLISRLGINTQRNSLIIHGIESIESSAKSSCNIQIKSRYNSYNTQLTCFVVNTIAIKVPHFSFESFDIPHHVNLADPDYSKSGDIDLLIGAQRFWDLIQQGQINLGLNKPIVQNTRLGWIVSGPMGNSDNHTNIAQVNTTISHDHTNIAVEQLENHSKANHDSIETQLEKFWNIEECINNRQFTREEEFCEDHFKNTVSVNLEGRFMVEMPLRKSPSCLGHSRETAVRRFLNLEKRLQQNPTLYDQYKQFMNEYIELGHMTDIDNSDKDENEYYIPHHAVVKNDGDIRKIRVVFDASSKTTNGISLNDIQYVGPVIQDSLFQIILRFRTHNHVVSADIIKMYRQILMKPNHRALQKIVWRDNSTAQLKNFKLNTVTYGTAAGSFQAIRCLREVANNIEHEEPLVANAIKKDFYVDDFLSGANTISEAIDLANKVNHYLTKSCLNLSKWMSNDSNVIKQLYELNNDDANFSLKPREFGKNERSKTLGLLWSPQFDTLSYKVEIEINDTPTKRKLLSAISQIFDPLGLMAPVTITAKIILQKLWSHNFDWDEPINETILAHWNIFYQQLSALRNITIPRQVILKRFDNLQLHGYCDASEQAYGACIYLRTSYKNEVKVNLLTAKSKVAPLKTITIPRLELCGAQLLAKLYSHVIKSLHNLQINESYLWTDSFIVLAWLKLNPSTLKTFVSHRVADIQNRTSSAVWQHVSTKENPSDILSRGVHANELAEHTLWWHGPSYLSSEMQWPIASHDSEIDIPELKTASAISAAIVIHESIVKFENFSNLSKLELIIAYVFRFIHNARNSKCKRTGIFSVDEINKALIFLIKESQKCTFSKEIQQLKANDKNVNVHSKLSMLCPFIDDDGILRVGGRIAYSNFDYNKKHPALLDSTHALALLIARREHVRRLHIGPQGLLSMLREKFWLISGRNLTRKVVHDCIQCFRARPRFEHPKMGNLPQARITPSFPFANSGTDYAGPVMLKTSNTRGCKSYKAYIGIFVCLVTKAIHLELITALTSDAFIATLRRFTSRRGLPQHIYSDNGTNFVGAKGQFKELFKFLKDQSEEISRFATQQQFSWHFSPARAPHFGGIWEAGVRSVKAHLERVLGDRVLTYEDYATFLTQIEGILNSRPLSAMSSDPNDYSPLTPAHFLIGRPIIGVMDSDVRHIVDSKLGRYQRIQAMVQHFWSRWSKEYVHQLQTRAKWKRETDSDTKIKEGALVLIADEMKPVHSWKLARIEKLHPGKDDITRVVTLRTRSGNFQRPVTKICVLPIE